MEELIENNIQTKLPFTVDPRPIDHTNIKYSLTEKLAFKFMYGKKAFYENLLYLFGLFEKNAFTFSYSSFDNRLSKESFFSINMDKVFC